MEKLSRMNKLIGETTFLDKASVPIIKAVCTGEYRYKSVDISFQHEYHNGLQSVELIKSYLKIYP